MVPGEAIYNVVSTSLVCYHALILIEDVQLMQRLYEWRGALARTALEAVSEFFEENKENYITVEARAAYVEQVLGKGLLFRYREFYNSEDGAVVCYLLILLLHKTHFTTYYRGPRVPINPR